MRDGGKQDGIDCNRSNQCPANVAAGSRYALAAPLVDCNLDQRE